MLSLRDGFRVAVCLLSWWDNRQAPIPLARMKDSRPLESGGCSRLSKLAQRHPPPGLNGEGVWMPAEHPHDDAVSIVSTAHSMQDARQGLRPCFRQKSKCRDRSQRIVSTLSCIWSVTWIQYEVCGLVRRKGNIVRICRFTSRGFGGFLLTPSQSLASRRKDRRLSNADEH